MSFKNRVLGMAAILIVFLVASPVFAVVLPLTSLEKIPQNRLQFDPSLLKTSSLPVLAQARLAFRSDDFKTCYRLSETGYQSEMILRPWIAVQSLQCAVGEAQDKTSGLEHLQHSLARVDAHAEWLLLGPQVSALRSAYVQAQLLLAQKALRDHRPITQKAFLRLLEMRPWISREQMAEVYDVGGELTFLTQEWPQSQDYFYRSLELKDSDELRTRIEGLKKFLPEDTDKPIESPKATITAPAVVEVSEEEEAIYARVQSALNTGDLVSACEDGAKLIEKFPGGRRARWVEDRILESYLILAQRTNTENVLIRERVVKSMLRVDGGRLFDWAAAIFQKGFYSDAFLLAEQSYSLMRGHPDSTAILRLASRSALVTGDTAAAKKYLNLLILEHAGTTESVEAGFRLGLLYYRDHNWNDALAAFERVLALPGSDDFQYSTLYWYWRTQQKIRPTDANKTAEQLMNRFPLSYYGLRARAELNASKLQFPAVHGSQELKSSMLLTQNEFAGFRRLRALLPLGWFPEAQEELKLLPHGRTRLQQILMARFYSAALDNNSAFRILNQAFEQDPTYFRRDVIEWDFPKEYEKLAVQESHRVALTPVFLLAIMRQESSFRYDAVSSSQAYGLMQLLVPTAREIATDLKMKLKAPWPRALFDPPSNIRLGAIYISRLLKTFKGHVPLALAAYNIGPGNLRKFLQARPVLKNLEDTRSDPDDEIWIDELPWSETSGYVKAVLRNLLIYEWLGAPRGEMETQIPLWSLQSIEKRN